MAKLITGKWEEALKMLSDCKVVQTPGVPRPDTLVMVLQDPTGQQFILEVRSRPMLGTNGNLVTLSGAFEMKCMEPEPGDRIGERQW